MLRSVKDMESCTIGATDGTIGRTTKRGLFAIWW